MIKKIFVFIFFIASINLYAEDKITFTIASSQFTDTSSISSASTVIDNKNLPGLKDLTKENITANPNSFKEFNDIIQKLNEIYYKKNSDNLKKETTFLGTKGKEISNTNFDLLLLWK